MCLSKTWWKWAHGRQVPSCLFFIANNVKNVIFNKLSNEYKQESNFRFYSSHHISLWYSKMQIYILYKKKAAVIARESVLLSFVYDSKQLLQKYLIRALTNKSMCLSHITNAFFWVSQPPNTTIKTGNNNYVTLITLKR